MKFYRHQHNRKQADEEWGTTEEKARYQEIRKKSKQA